jgi:hypothetical protein
MKFTRLLRYITPHISTLLLVLLLLVADSFAALAQPWVAGKLTGAALGGGGGISAAFLAMSSTSPVGKSA